MTDNKKDKPRLGRGLSALISNPIINNNEKNIESGNAALNVNSIFSKNFEREKAKELADKTKGIKKSIKLADSQKVDNELQISKNNIVQIPINKIIANAKQPREDFSEKSLGELSISISKHGVLQPILVRKIDDKYEIVAGERRFRAAKLAGLKEVPVIFKDLEEDDAYEIAVIENIQRENLNPIEEANAYKKLMTIGKITQNELAEKIGKDRATIANLIRILDLPNDVQELIKTKEISLGHAKVLLSLKKIEAQKSFAKKIVNDGLSVRELERLVSEVWVLDAGKAHKDFNSSDKRIQGSKKESKFSDIIDLLREKLGTRVDIKHQKSGKGKIEIEYYSIDELDRVVQEITKDVVNI